VDFEVQPSAPEYTVADEDYSLQEYLNYLHIGTAWGRRTGQNAVVAVIDTGIDTDHPDFAGKISPLSYNASEDKVLQDCVTDNGYDYSVIEDEHGHGTAVAGVIGAKADQTGTIGIAHNAKLLVIKAECKENGEFVRTSDLSFGIYYAVQNGADIINMSFSNYEEDNYFEDAIDLNNKEASAHFGYARANAKMGCTDIALASYEKAVMLAPGNIEYATELNRYREEHSLEIKDSNGVKPSLDEPILNVITPIASENSKISQDEPVTFESLVEKADSAYKNQKYDEALDLYTKAVVFNPSDKITMLKIANIYKLKGNNAKAISFYDKIISIDKDSTDAYFNKGLVFANQKKYDDAIKCFEKVTELTPEYPYAYYSLAMAYELKDNPKKAIEYYLLYLGVEKDEKMISLVKQRIKELEAGLD
jgi:tetratricopeptide (TPR) repeat protein